MTIGQIALLVACGLGWSVLDVLRKRLASEVGALALVTFLTLGQLPVLLVWAIATPLPDAMPGLSYFGAASAAIGLNVIANLCFVEAVKRSPLSLTVPLLSLTPALAASLAMPILGERLAPRELLGVALVVVGALMLARSGSHPARGLGWWRRLFHEPGVPLMLVVSLSWSLTLSFDKIGVRAVGPAWHAVVLTAGVAAGTGTLLLARGEIASLHLPRSRGVLGLAVAVSASALALQLLAVQAVLVGLVEAVKRGIGNLAALGFGWLVFSEPLSLDRLAALGTMAIGVVLLLT